MPLLMVLYVVLLIVAGSHLVRYRGSNGWLLAIVFLPFVGSLSYILMVMKPSWLAAPRQRPAVVIERGPYSREYKDPANQVLDEATRRLDERDPTACRELLEAAGTAASPNCCAPAVWRPKAQRTKRSRPTKP
jgi:hypothetical protein